jgi:gluconate 2-dehydrogenase gamma chain
MMRPIGISPSRRAFLGRVLAAAPAIAAVSGEIAHPARALVASAPLKQNQPEIYQPKYFTTEEWTLLTALVDRLIPADEEGPGALEAGAAEFIDRQMTEPYGHGALWYMQGPFRQASPEFGYQLKYTPCELYRAALPAVDQAVRVKHGKAFTDLGDDAKDAVIGELQHGQLAIGDIPSSTFFDQLWQNTHEGYFCDPVHGGNKGMAAWRMINFPGARADYMDWVEQYGRKYPFPPTSLGAPKG